MTFGTRGAGVAEVNSPLGGKAECDDFQANAWEELVSKNGNHPGHCAVRHESSHTKVDHLVDIGATVAETLAITTILDTALNVPGSGLNLLGTPMPDLGGDVSDAAPEVASGFLDSFFNG